MALVDITPTPLQMEGMFANPLGSTGLTASGHKVGAIFEAPVTGTIDRVVWRTGTVSGATPQVDVRLETVSGSSPSGTLAGTNSNALVTVASNTNYDTALTTGLSVNRGDLLATVFAYSSGTSIQIGISNSLAYYYSQLSNILISTGGSYSVISGRRPYGGVRYSDGTYKKLRGYAFGVSSVSLHFTTGEKGLRFRLPFKCRVNGFWCSFDPDGDCVFKLYADATSPGGTALLSKTINSASFSTAITDQSIINFNSTSVLDANTWYRLVMAPTGAGIGVRYNFSDLQSVDMAPLCGIVGDHYLSESSGSTWTNTTTRFPWMGVMIDQIDDGASTGGGLILPRPMNVGYSA
jgi:hypothetical protein